jgi:large subunit ribosomal protein L22
MEARAIARHVRVSPQKAKIIADLVRGKSVEKALEILKFSKRYAAKPIQKTVMSAMHNLAGMSEHPIEPAHMDLKEIRINEGKTMYRIRARAQGRAYRIRKRSSHIIVVVEHKEAAES